MNLRLPLLLTFLMLLSFNSSFAQKAKYLGLTGTMETSTKMSFKPGFRFQYEQRFSRRSGFETGLAFRNYLVGGVVTSTDASNNILSSINVAERYLSIPALYKFHTKIVDISAGPSLEFYLGWKQTTPDPNYTLTDYGFVSAFNLALMAKVSKDIRINQQFFVEPEVGWNPVLTSKRGYLGLGIGAKYKL